MYKYLLFVLLTAGLGTHTPVPASDHTATPNNTSSSLDLDGNGRYEASKDGLLLLRHLFGFSDDALIDGAIGTDARYTSADAVATRILQLGSLADIDDDARENALTDGLLIWRYLSGYEDNVLLEGVIGDDAYRTSPEQIRNQLNSLAPSIVQTQKMSQKRGLTYGTRGGQQALTGADLEALSAGNVWWYNWGISADPDVQHAYTNYGFDFVPMAWGKRFDEQALRSFLDNHADVKYLLGFNEPNFASQANLTPSEAAALWPRLERIADDYNLKLVSPAVNFSPGDVDIPGTDDDGNPWVYLDAFFAACTDCRVDYIAVHGYMKDTDFFKRYVQRFERYEKPIWVTEWAAVDGGGPADIGEQMDYLAETVRWLERNDQVYRYAWFVARSRQGLGQAPYLDLLADEGVLTPLGNLYVGIPGAHFSYPLPARIEAEGAQRLEGFVHQPSTDITGFVDLTASTPAFLEYDIVLDTDGGYAMSLRLFITTHPNIRVTLNGELLYDLGDFSTASATGWTTLKGPNKHFTKGTHTLRIETSGVFRCNWLALTQ